MSTRKRIHEPIKFQVYPWSTQQRQLVWKDLIATEGLLENDIVEDITWDKKTQESCGWGYDADYDDEVILHTIFVTVKRWRDETDDEFLERMRKETEVADALREREKLEYLRLKAKFENDGTIK